MGKIVKAIVDLPVRKLNKEFDYLIPAELENILEVGHLIKVPFSNRKVAAFVTEVDAEAEIAHSKIKKVNDLIYSKPFFDKKMLSLFRWIAAYYHSYLIQVIKAALPPGITEKKVGRKKLKYIKLKAEINDHQKILDKLDKRAPKQYQIYSYLLANKDKIITLKKAAEHAKTSKQTVYRLIEKDLLELYDDYIDRIPEINQAKYPVEENTSKLIAEDHKLIENIFTSIVNSKADKFLLESSFQKRKFIFLRKLIDKTIAEANDVIILVPEIEKDLVLIKKLKNYYQDKIALLHSQLSQGERFDAWRRIQRSEVSIVVGARSAIFAPFNNLKLIIILEENNHSYKQQEHPLYHARQVAVRRQKENGAVLVLEAAFPSIESKYFAEQKKYKSLKLAKENDRQIKTQLVDLKKEVEAGNLSDLSRELKDKILNNLENKQKTLLFLNRRGYGNYVICKKCGNVIKCDNCDISLHYHKADHKLSCHYCGSQKYIPDNCPECGSSFVSPAGIGTENIVKQLKEIYQNAVIKRIDSDLKDNTEKIFKDFKNDKIDILVGTQLIIKHDYYDNLNLLGVISADTALNSSDFRAAENTFQLLSELKSLLLKEKESEFIIQSFNPEHFSISNAADSNYDNFYKKELELRNQRKYPPFCRLLNIIIQGAEEKSVADKAIKISDFLDNWEIYYQDKMGAAPAAIKKIRNKFRWQIILKFNSFRNREYIIQLLEKKFIENAGFNLEIRIDVDPYKML
ncbi:replication restart helicase PriA [Halanaerobium hydrogeniformans]|uniref:Probable replication restart protein PriA n=1 Tax=Halanaerobium hydrogeniformans TaxID=656519 RepID=E4RLU2_HALHG|nr:primosomal protein N' [Halanaerobium hydrogeniformans]ADQ15006.1 primosomal protein N' [Halanaerobium hydrogeniformans]